MSWFFPAQRRILKPGPLRDGSITANLMQITHQQPRRMLADLTGVFGVLVLENDSGDRAAYEFVNPAADATTTTIMPLAAVDSSPADGAAGGLGGSL